MGEPSRVFLMRSSRLFSLFIRWAFERLYHEFAWTYDAVATLVSAGHWPAWALTSLPYLRGRTLELGCGTGYVQLALSRPPAGPWAVGLDRSAQMLTLTQRKLAHHGSAARLVRGDARALPFQASTFDTVVATFPSEYIAAPATLREARRVLSAGGRFVIVIGAELGGSGLYPWVVALAYRLTLQPSPRAAATGSWSGRLDRELAAAGFVATAHWLHAPGGTVALLVAEVR